MRCFNHPTEAVGICKHCQRALCLECCSDMDDGLACKGKHEGEVEHLNSLIQNTKKSYESSPKASLFAPVFNVFLGILFVIFGLSEASTFLLVMGLGFMAFGIITFVHDRNFFKKIKTDYEP